MGFHQSRPKWDSLHPSTSKPSARGFSENHGSSNDAGENSPSPEAKWSQASLPTSWSVRDEAERPCIAQKSSDMNHGLATPLRAGQLSPQNSMHGDKRASVFTSITCIHCASLLVHEIVAYDLCCASARCTSSGLPTVLRCRHRAADRAAGLPFASPFLERNPPRRIIDKESFSFLRVFWHRVPGQSEVVGQQRSGTSVSHPQNNEFVGEVMPFAHCVVGVRGEVEIKL